MTRALFRYTTCLLLASSLLACEAALKESPDQTGSSPTIGGAAVVTPPPIPCPTCALPPTAFVRNDLDADDDPGEEGGRERGHPEWGRTFFGDPTVDYVLVVQDDGGPRTGAIIRLNGRSILKARELRGVSVTEIRKPVTLQKVNRLRVIPLGKRGAKVVVWILSGSKIIDQAGGTVRGPGGSAVSVPPDGFASGITVGLTLAAMTGGTFGDDEALLQDEPRASQGLEIAYTGTGQPAADLTVWIRIPHEFTSIPAGALVVPYAHAFSQGGEQIFRYLPLVSSPSPDGRLQFALPPWAFSNLEGDSTLWRATIAVGLAPPLPPGVSVAAPNRLANSLTPTGACRALPPAGKILAPLTTLRPNTAIASSGFGVWRYPKGAAMYRHTGVDLQVDPDTKVYAAMSGTAQYLEQEVNVGFGNFVVITDSNGSKTLYGHLNGVAGVLSGLGAGGLRPVQKGELIGLSGQSGNASKPDGGGPQLHFEYAPIMADFRSEITPKQLKQPVIDPDPCQAVINSLTFTPPSLSLAVGGTAPIAVTASDASGQEIQGLAYTWESAQPGVADIQLQPPLSATYPQQTIRGLSPGTAIVKASTGGFPGTATVTVTAPSGGGGLAGTGSGTSCNDVLTFPPAGDLSAASLRANALDGSPFVMPVLANCYQGNIYSNSIAQGWVASYTQFCPTDTSYYVVLGPLNAVPLSSFPQLLAGSQCAVYLKNWYSLYFQQTFSADAASLASILHSAAISGKDTVYIYTH